MQFPKPVLAVIPFLISVCAWADPQSELAQAITENNDTTVLRVQKIIAQSRNQLDFKAAFPNNPKKDNLYTLAARVGNVAVLQEIWNATQSNGDDHLKEDKATPLFLVAQEGHLEAAKFLVSKGADFNLIFPDRLTPAFQAIGHKQPEILEFFLDQGLHVNQTFSSGGTGTSLLHLAAQTGDLRTVDLLLRRKAKVDVPNPQGEGMTPLKVAVQLHHPQVVEILLKAGARPDLPDPNGATPLFIAASAGDTKSTELLLKSGADVDIETNNRVSPLKEAALRAQAEILRLLFRHRARATSTWEAITYVDHLISSKIELPDSGKDFRKVIPLLKIVRDHGYPAAFIEPYRASLRKEPKENWDIVAAQLALELFGEKAIQAVTLGSGVFRTQALENPPKKMDPQGAARAMKFDKAVATLMPKMAHAFVAFLKEVKDNECPYPQVKRPQNPSPYYRLAEALYFSPLPGSRAARADEENRSHNEQARSAEMATQVAAELAPGQSLGLVEGPVAEKKTGEHKGETVGGAAYRESKAVSTRKDRPTPSQNLEGNSHGSSESKSSSAR